MSTATTDRVRQTIIKAFLGPHAASHLALLRTVWLVGLISLINDSAGEMLYPIIPLYLSSVLMVGPAHWGSLRAWPKLRAALLKLFRGGGGSHTAISPLDCVRLWPGGFSRPLIALVSAWPGLLLVRFG